MRTDRAGVNKKSALARPRQFVMLIYDVERVCAQRERVGMQYNHLVGHGAGVTPERGFWVEFVRTQQGSRPSGPTDARESRLYMDTPLTQVRAPWGAWWS